MHDGRTEDSRFKVKWFNWLASTIAGARTQMAGQNSKFSSKPCIVCCATVPKHLIPNWTIMELTVTSIVETFFNQYIYALIIVTLTWWLRDPLR
jgi:hypothetical protein